LHLADNHPCLVGDFVTIGHSAIVHACTVNNEVLVGMGATLLDGAHVGEQCIIGARALLTEGQQVPPGSLVLGVPAKVVRELTAEERASIKALAEKYVQAANYCLQHGINVSQPLPS
jgi:carbonic anhydrase/acetyltransferase-like protein (isoleucine patch superfamily)